MSSVSSSTTRLPLILGIEPSGHAANSYLACVMIDPNKSEHDGISIIGADKWKPIHQVDVIVSIFDLIGKIRMIDEFKDDHIIVCINASMSWADARNITEGLKNCTNLNKLTYRTHTQGENVLTGVITTKESRKNISLILQKRYHLQIDSQQFVGDRSKLLKDFSNNMCILREEEDELIYAFQVAVSELGMGKDKSEVSMTESIQLSIKAHFDSLQVLADKICTLTDLKHRDMLLKEILDANSKLMKSIVE